MKEKNKVVKDEIRARLTVYGIGEMTPKKYLAFRQWLSKHLQEFNREKKEVFNQKRYRATLYK